MYRTHLLMLKYVVPVVLAAGLGLAILGIHIPWYFLPLILLPVALLILLVAGRLLFEGEQMAAWLPPVRRQLIAAREPTPPPRPTQLLTWTDPAGRYTAELLLPDYFEGPDARVTVVFHRPDRVAAVELADPATAPELAGVPGQVTAGGVARFDLAALQGTVEPRLVVGGAVWTFQGSRPLS